jgi:hypothetical protein
MHLVLIFVGIVLLLLFRSCFLVPVYSRAGRRTMIDRGRKIICKIDLEKIPCYDYVAKENMDCSIKLHPRRLVLMYWRDVIS